MSLKKTTSTDYGRVSLVLLNVHFQDELIEPCANRVNLTAAMASSSLNKKRSERVINPALHKSTEPPWGTQDPGEWAKG